MKYDVERKHPRVRVALQGELRAYSDVYPRRAETTDLSLGGCYFAMPHTLEPKTRTEVVLWLDGMKLTAKAEVVTNHPQVGNGVKFLNMGEEDRKKLEAFIASVMSGANTLYKIARA